MRVKEIQSSERGPHSSHKINNNKKNVNPPRGAQLLSVEGGKGVRIGWKRLGGLCYA
jgi:hypothetical protein